ncbi:MAG: hypothetical protein ACI4EE_12995 [Lachnospiraceae bacterium]
MYTSITSSFLNSIQALRFYIESVELKSLSALDGENSNVVFAILMYMSKELKINRFDIDDLSFPEEIPETMAHDIKQIIRDMEELFDVSQDGKSGRYPSLPKSLKESYRAIQAVTKQNEILYSGALLLLMTYFENTVSKILKADFQRHPQRMALESKTVSYKILEMSESIEDVKNHLIEDEVTSIMYKSVSDWIEYFKRNIKLKLEYMIEVLPQLKEIIARRNIIVHNEGVVNTIYLNSISTNDSSSVKQGDILTVDKEYVIEAVNLVESVGMSLIVEMWINEFAQDDDEVGKIVSLIYDEYLIFDKWENAQILYDICLKSKKLKDADELLCKINRWQCYKWQGRFEEVRSDVEKQDISACKDRYALGVMALLDKYEEFFDYYEKQNDIGEEELKEWPLFREIRECDIYKEKYGTNCICIEENH